MSEYRYMIWNDLKKEYQFPRICETTEKGANTLLFKLIGDDARKDRFKIVKVEKEKAKTIVKELKQKYKAERIHREIPNIDFEEILELVRRNYWRVNNMGEDRVIAHRFAVMQKQIDEKDKRIQDLEEESRKKSIELICYQEELENSIPTQVVIDKIKELEKLVYEIQKSETCEEYPCGEDIIYRTQIDILQELLEEEK